MTNRLHIATFNVLADAYINCGGYGHTSLMKAGSRTQPLVSLINGLGADIVGLQEVEWPLVEALTDAGNWQPFWSKKRECS